ncbi:MAG: transketolase, partial [Actinobacteria bacterium]|nr:transketolase [Actinomycetota bacterium]
MLAATANRDATVLYVTSVRPLDSATLRDVAATDVILVETSLAGATTSAVMEALRDRPHRILSLGVRNEELRRYGT